MPDTTLMWEEVFIAGEYCKDCLFSEPTLDITKESKKATRECVARSPNYCIGVEAKLQEQQNNG